MLNPSFARWIECVQHLVRLAQGMSTAMMTHVTIEYPKGNNIVHSTSKRVVSYEM
jgi:hypothetical protein